ncbi:M23 family metallopeptidase [Micromonospora endolithica]|uniref:M23 family peptidase n=1 Tax=Micromonospora endolithica TaxID=230091 RepID=A0A3A9Z3P1_9ACTN|nr:M23 family metallopeptidase [Micromonospora endolithica]RKN42810.1 M23 family peptidase [Micromonospora endolithica]TWJ25334.1 peptidase M23-like protein [Micromonospora endolithica]
MPLPPTGRRRAYPALLLLVPLVAAACATSRPGTAQGTPAARASTPPVVADQPSAAATGRPTGTATPNGTASPGGTAAAPARAGLPHVFPVRARKVAYHPTHSAYPGTDIFADCGEPFVAVTDGTVLEVSRVDRFAPQGPRGPYNGGLSVSLLGDDGVRYYGSHLTEIADGVDAGARVRAGRQLGTVGRTGNANNVCHLHFGISPPCTGRDGWWIRRGVVWPAPYLDAWRRKINREPAAEVSAWHRRHGCPKAPGTAR